MNKGIPNRSDEAIEAFVESMTEKDRYDCYIYWKIDEQRNRTVGLRSTKLAMVATATSKSESVKAIDFVEKEFEHNFATLDHAARFIAWQKWTVDAAPEAMIGSDDVEADFISSNDWDYFFEQLCRWQDHFLPDQE